MKSLRLVLPLVVLPLGLIGCGDDSGGDDDDDVVDAAPTVDSAPTIDSAPTVDAPPTIDAGPTIDAIPSSLDCVGQPLPTVAIDPVNISGVSNQLTVNGLEPLAGVALSARLASNDSEVASTVSAEDGTYDMDIATDNIPVSGYIRATASGFIPNHLYPPTPLAVDTTSGTIAMISDSVLALIAVFVGTTIDPTKGMMAVVVVDCNGDPIDGAVITTDPPGELVYVIGNLPDPNAETTGPRGLAFILNVPAGPVVVDASVGDVSLREHTIESYAGEATTTVVVP